MKTIATVFGVGRLPLAPGTFGSLVGLGFIWLLSYSGAHQLAGTLIATALGLWSAGPAARAMGKTDPGSIVIDEVAGMMVSLALLPVSFEIYLVGFFLFRFLDVVKPFPIRQLQVLPGSWGIMLDDLLAGLEVNLLLHLFLRFF